MENVKISDLTVGVSSDTDVMEMETPAGEGRQVTRVQVRASGCLHLVHDLGAIGDGTIHPLSERYGSLTEAQVRYPDATSLTDSIDGSAIQEGVSQGRCIFVPIGDFVLNKSIVVTKQRIVLNGDNQSFADMARIIGDASMGAQPMFRQSHGWIDIDNQHRDPNGNLLPSPQPPASSGTCTINVNKTYFDHRGAAHAGVFMINFLASSSSFRDCYFSHGDGRGVAVGACFSVMFDTCRFLPDYANDTVTNEDAFKRTAIIPGGHCAIINCDFVRCGMGVALHGSGVNLMGGRFEVNIYGVNIGEVPSLVWEFLGNDKQWKTGWANGITFEQNRHAIDIGPAFGCELKNLSVQGSTTPGGVTSKTGIRFNSNNSDFLLRNCSVASFGVEFQNYIFNTKTLMDIKGIENVTGLTAVFDDTPSSTGYDFKGSNRSVPLQAKSDLVMRGLTQLVLDKGQTFARKLGGRITPGNGSTSESVAFLPSLGTGIAAFTAAAQAVSDVGSTLAPADYEYSTTLLNRLGETGIDDTLTLQSITIASQEKAVLTFTANSNASLRRIYRREVGDFVWDGYFEFLPDGTTCEDTGQAFDGVDAPPPQGHLTPTEIEDDADYEVMISPSWLTTARVTNKATTGFDMEFGTAAPTANETVSWLLFRA